MRRHEREPKLTAEERAIEQVLLSGALEKVSLREENAFKEAVVRFREHYRKDSVLSLRINGRDLGLLKEKARKRGIKYQTFISDRLHRAACV